MDVLLVKLNYYFSSCWRRLLVTSNFRWGSPEFIGLGFLSFVSIILTEIFGSPFLKNISIIVGLAVGCIVAGAAGYIDGSSIKTAPGITFLWYVFVKLICNVLFPQQNSYNRVYTFKIRVYAPAILPMLAVYSKLNSVFWWILLCFKLIWDSSFARNGSYRWYHGFRRGVKSWSWWPHLWLSYSRRCFGMS